MAEKKSISDMPVANPKLLLETARLTKHSKGKVEEIILFTGAYIAKTMRAGLMEAVMLPNFGKFKPKKSRVVAVHKHKINTDNGKRMIIQALKGRRIIDKRIIKPTDETL